MILRSGRSPFEIYLLAAAILTGVIGLFNPRPTGASAVLPLWELYTWDGGLIVGGLVALVGVCMSSPTSLLVERAGLLVLAGWSVGWAVLIGASLGMRATLSVLFVGAFGAACLTRALLIGADLRRVSAASAMLRSDHDGGD